ncbi:MAG: LuxR C-terminal-related transcriptional regulator [Ramlibacter sp.]
MRGLSVQLDLWAAQLIGVDKRSGRLTFSAEGGPASPQAALDYIRHYHRMNPRLGPAVATPLGKFMHCHEHFDEGYVATSPFYQEFLIPHGGRYLTGMKLIDDEDSLFMLGLMRGVGTQPFTAADDETLMALQHHGSEALRNYLHLRETFAELGMARDLLAQFSYPMVLVDETRGIWHRNAAAQSLLADGGTVRERNGMLYCSHPQSDLALTEAIHDLSVAHASGARSGVNRRVVNLRDGSGRRCLAFLSWISPESAMGSFGPTARALVTLHDPAADNATLDPFIVAECFNLTPAEARVAVQVASGASAKQIAQRMGVALPTVRTHLQRVLEKTSVERQADLIRVLLALPSRSLL